MGWAIQRKVIFMSKRSSERAGGLDHNQAKFHIVTVSGVRDLILFRLVVETCASKFKMLFFHIVNLLPGEGLQYNKQYTTYIAQ